MISDSGCAVGHDPIHLCSPNKRIRRTWRISRSSSASSNKHRQQQQQRFPIDALPDEILFEILRRIPCNNDRAAAAAVSKRWLSTLSGITRDADADTGSVTRFLQGEPVSDVSLAAATARANGFGGLGRLWIHGNGSDRITDAGLTAVARGSRSMKFLTIWDAPLVGDDSLREVARCCPMLEKLDLYGCPMVTDAGLAAIAEGCPNLSCLNLEFCLKVGNEGLRAIGSRCPLRSVSISSCPSVGDQGIASLVSLASSSLTRISLQNLDVSDVSLAVIGHYGKAVTDLVLCGLRNVNERGFWVMGNTRGLQSLKLAEITGCRGATDMGLEALAKGCPALKKLCLNRCEFLTDTGLAAVARTSLSLENLQLLECHRVTLVGIRASILKSSAELKSLAFTKCSGIRDTSCPDPAGLDSTRTSIRSITIRDCQFFGDVCLKEITKDCPKLQHIDLIGVLPVTKSGLLHLLQLNELELANVNLSGCGDVVDDQVVSVVARNHGGTLRSLNLEGCKKVTDASLVDICHNCDILEEVDVSRSAVTDFGISALATLGPPLLHIISLSGCLRISDDSLQFLSDALCLVGLDLRHCKQISGSAIQSLRKKMQHCDIIF